MATTLKQLLEEKLGELIYIFAFGANPSIHAPYILYGEYLLGPTSVDAPQGIYKLVDPPAVLELTDMPNHYVFSAKTIITLLCDDPELPPPPAPAPASFPMPSAELPPTFDHLEVMHLLKCSQTHAKHLIIAWTCANLIKQVPGGYYYEMIHQGLTDIPDEVPDELKDEFTHHDVAALFRISPERADYIIARLIHLKQIMPQPLWEGDLRYVRVTQENTLPEELPTLFLLGELGRWTQEGHAWNENLVNAWVTNGLVGHQYGEQYLRMDRITDPPEEEHTCKSDDPTTCAL